MPSPAEQGEGAQGGEGKRASATHSVNKIAERLLVVSNGLRLALCLQPGRVHLQVRLAVAEPGHDGGQQALEERLHRAPARLNEQSASGSRGVRVS